jgi:RimJ/RimL family protein N-acetyltransferase
VYLTPDVQPPTIRAVLAPSWPIETARLLLRPFEADDLESLHAIHSDAGVARWLYNEPRTLAETRELLGHKLGAGALRAEGDWLAAAAVVRETGELVADISLHWASEPHRQGELGFLVHPAHQGQGYATEAALAILDFAFGELGLHRVIGKLEARNAASERVLEKLGMRREAHLVENEWVKGEWQSELVYAILDREWHDAGAGGRAGDGGY